MKRDEIIPYLNKFVTLILKDGTEHSGYISNPAAIRNAENDQIAITLLNGFYSEDIQLPDVAFLRCPERTDTVSVPVMDLKKGYEQEPVEKKAEGLYTGEMDEELSELYHSYINRFGSLPDTRSDLEFDLMPEEKFKAILKKCLDENETIDVITDAFYQAYSKAVHHDE